MAPGIFPEVTSLLTKSSIEESFSSDNSAPGGGPSLTAVADRGAAAEAATLRTAERRMDARVRGNMRGNRDDADRMEARLLQCFNSIQTAPGPSGEGTAAPPPPQARCF